MTVESDFSGSARAKTYAVCLNATTVSTESDYILGGSRSMNQSRMSSVVKLPIIGLRLRVVLSDFGKSLIPKNYLVRKSNEDDIDLVDLNFNFVFFYINGKNINAYD